MTPYPIPCRRWNSHPAAVKSGKEVIASTSATVRVLCVANAGFLSQRELTRNAAHAR
jgi:hypothetical protein